MLRLENAKDWTSPQTRCPLIVAVESDQSWTSSGPSARLKSSKKIVGGAAPAAVANSVKRVAVITTLKPHSRRLRRRTMSPFSWCQAFGLAQSHRAIRPIPAEMTRGIFIVQILPVTDTLFHSQQRHARLAGVIPAGSVEVPDTWTGGRTLGAVGRFLAMPKFGCILARDLFLDSG